MTTHTLPTQPKKPLELKTIVDFAQRKGFVYQGSEIYGGLANTWDYGPKGVLLKDNIKNAWKQHFIYERTDMVEIDAGIFMNPKVWEASGHIAGFADCMIDCKECKSRFRADHLIEKACNIDVEGWTPEQITLTITDKIIKCPKCKAQNWTEARYMNLMFETNRDKSSTFDYLFSDEMIEGDLRPMYSIPKDIIEMVRNTRDKNNIYLRPETAQGIFVNFKNIMQSERRKLPFGIGQIGKAFRNEISPGNFNFRVIEFEQMEIEYFIKPTTDEAWQQKFAELLEMQKDFLTNTLGIAETSLVEKKHSEEKLSHYSKKSTDWNYNYPFGSSELTGLAYRTDFDLKQHSEHSGIELNYLDTETNQKFIPHCIEPTVGVDRLFLAIMCEFYCEEEIGTPEKPDTRIVFKLPINLAPYKLAILPLMKKDGLGDKAQEIYKTLRKAGLSCDYDEAGSIGKRYRRQDENGTLACVCVDYQTLEDQTVTVRHRDTMQQTRVAISELVSLG